MSFKFSNIFQYFEYLPFIDSIVEIVHDLTDKGSPTLKAVNVVEDLFDTVINYANKTNPRVANELARIYDILKPELDKLVASETTHG